MNADQRHSRHTIARRISQQLAVECLRSPFNVSTVQKTTDRNTRSYHAGKHLTITFAHRHLGLQQCWRRRSRAAAMLWQAARAHQQGHNRCHVMQVGRAELVTHFDFLTRLRARLMKCKPNVNSMSSNASEAEEARTGARGESSHR